MPSLLAALNEGGNYDLALANGGDLQVFAVPNTLPSPAATLIFVPNFATLRLVSTAGLVQGSAAFVETVQAYFNWEPANVQADDNATIISATGGGNWLRGSQANTPAAWAQTTWFFDRANVSGAANDENSGLTAALPLLHKAEYARRVGGTAARAFPPVNATTTYKFLSVGTVAQEQADALNWEPQIGEGVFALIDGPDLGSAGNPAAFTGTLLAVTAKNTALGGGPLQSTFTTTTGAVAVAMLLVNATRANSFSIAVSNAAGTWTLQQPLTPFVPGSAAPTEVDTWANGDAITGYVLPAICVQQEEGSVLTLTAAASSLLVRNLTIGVAPNDLCLWRGGVQAGQCVFASRTFFYPSRSVSTFIGCHFTGFHESWAASYSASSFNTFGAFRTPAFSNDCLFHGATAYQVAALDDSSSFGNLCIDTGAKVVPHGFWRGFAAAIYGGGTLDAHGIVGTAAGGGTVTYNVATLLLNGVATGYSMATAAGVTTIHGGIALSNANLVAAAGAAGFGGTATNLAGCCFTNAGAQP